MSRALAKMMLVWLVLFGFGFPTVQDAHGQTISSFAGDGSTGYGGDGGPATAASLQHPGSLSLDAAGNVYLADTGNHRVRRIDRATGIITTVAGSGTQGSSGDGGPATLAELDQPWGLVVAPNGDVFVAGMADYRVRRIGAGTGTITTVAGDGTAGFMGDGGPATEARLGEIRGLALDAAGNLYVADVGNHRVRRVTMSTGIITTIAGTGVPGYSGDGGLATGAMLNGPVNLVWSAGGDLYIVDHYNHRVRRVDGRTGTISTVAGGVAPGYAGDGGPATGASLTYPSGVAADTLGNLYIADSGNRRVRRIDHVTGVINTVAGAGEGGAIGDGGLARSAHLAWPNVPAIAGPDLLITDWVDCRVRRVTVGEPTNIVMGTPGGGSMEFVRVDPGTFTMGDAGWGPAHEVTLTQGFYLAKTELTQGQWQAVMGTTPWSGHDYVHASAENPAVWVSWDDAQGLVHALNAAAGDSLYRLPTEAEWEYACRAGTSTRWSFGDNPAELGQYAWYGSNAWSVGLQWGQVVGTKLPNPFGLHDTHGNVWEWVQDWYGDYSVGGQIDPPGPASGGARVNRGGSFGADGDGSRSAIRGAGAQDFRSYDVGVRLVLIAAPTPSNAAPRSDAGADQTAAPGGTVTLDGRASSDADGDPLTYRWIAPAGIVLSDSTASQSTFTPSSAGTYSFVLVVNDGTVDSPPDTVVVTVTASLLPLGPLRTVAGTDLSGYNGDSGPATAATFDHPIDLTFDVLGNLYVADKGNGAVRRIGLDSVVTTVAASLAYLNSVAIAPVSFDGQPANTLYMFNDNQQLRLESSGQVTRPYNLGWGYMAFDGAGNRFVTDRYRVYRAPVGSPNSYEEVIAGLATQTPRIWASADGTLYIADAVAHVVRRVAPGGAASVVAGDGTSVYRDAGLASESGLTYPFAVTGDGAGSLYVLDRQDTTYAVRRISPTGMITTISMGGNVATDSSEYLQLPYRSYAATPSQGEPYDANVAFRDGKLYLLVRDRVVSLAVPPLVANTPPVAHAGVDQAAASGSTVTLDGRASNDTDGDPLTYRWTAPMGITLSDSTAAQPTFSTTTAGRHRFALTVNDGTVDSAPDTVVVIVTSGERAAGDTLTMSLPGGATMEFVWIVPGTSTTGSPDSEPGRSSDESPQHQVTLARGFYLAKTELTQGQWTAVMGTSPWVGQSQVQASPNNPAVYISWEDVQGLVQTLNQAAGDSLYRLPSEAEWEYACRAGTTTAWSFGDDAGQLGQFAWYGGNNLGYARPVGTKLPNPWGLYDMHGNVFEWAQDWYGGYGSGAQTDPFGPPTGSVRVLRGGGFGHDAQHTRSAFRFNYTPDFRYSYIGARLLLMAASPPANTLPHSDAGPDQTVASGATVTLDGRASSDADGDSLRYLWTAPPGVTLSDSTAAQPTFTPIGAGTYTLVLVVNDGTVDSAPDTVVVTVIGRGRASGDSLTVALPGGATMDFVWIEPGRFTMGVASLGDAPHQVWLTQGFYLGRYEVTQSQWQAVMAATPWLGQPYARANGSSPASYLSWNDAEEFVHALNQAAGDSLYRLPTEAEWECAARAGTTAAWSFGDDEGPLDSHAWYRANAWNMGLTWAQAVGGKLRNKWGLHDTYGNVTEWVQDWYAPYNGPTETNPSGPHSGADRVVRGGGFNNAPPETYSAARYAIDPNYRNGDVGMRLLLMAASEPPRSDAGQDQTVTAGAVVQLDASASSDADGDSLRYLWTAPPGVALSDSTAAQPTFVATTAGTFSFALVVADGAAMSVLDTVVVTVNQTTSAEGGIITTFAGSGPGPWGDGGPATEARIGMTRGVAVGPDGSVYIAGHNTNKIRRVAPDGTITTIAGTGADGYSGDGGPAADAQMTSPNGIAVDAAGNVFFCEFYGNRVRRVSPEGIITTVAGTGVPGYDGDPGPATAAQLWGPRDVAVDAAGNLYIGDRSRVTRVDTSGRLSTVAGPATGAGLSPTGPCLAVNPTGGLLVSDHELCRVFHLGMDGVLTPVVGTGVPGSAGDGGAATNAQLNGPYGVALDVLGNLYIAELDGYRVRRVTADGTITTFAGTGAQGSSGDGGLATRAAVSPYALAVGALGELYVDEILYVDGVYEDRIRKVVTDLSAFTHLAPTSQWITIYGTVLTEAGDPAPVGTVVDVLDEAGNTAGWSQVAEAGQYGFLSVYLDDPETVADEGAVAGETLRIRVNGIPTRSSVVWTSFGDVARVDIYGRTVAENRPPVLSPIGPRVVAEVDSLTFVLSSTDADRDRATYSVSNSPAGASLAAGVFGWRPTYDQAGSYAVTFAADDSLGGHDEEQVTITVTPTNRPPVLSPQGDLAVDEWDTLAVVLAASDPDGDNLTYAVGEGAPGAAVRDSVLTWVPDYGQTGVHSVVVTVNDGHGGRDSTTVSITVSSHLRQVQLQLASGFNLVSWPVDTRNDSVQALVAPIAADLIQVQGFETAALHVNGAGTGAKLYTPTGGSFNTLRATDHRLGYWIKMRSPRTLAVTGRVVDGAMQIPLAPGFNLVSYLAGSVDSTRHAVASAAAGLVQVQGFETGRTSRNPPLVGAKLYLPTGGSFNTLRIMSPLMGYWVKVAEAMALTYPGAPAPGTPSARLVAEEGPVLPTDQWVAIYGQVLTPDGNQVPAGTVVDVVDQAGHCAGWFAVETPGLYGYLPVYLDDPETPVDEGAVVGECLQVRVNGVATGMRVQWTEFGDVVRRDLVAVAPDAGVPSGVPASSVLHGAYPNPFNPATTISYGLAQAGDVRLQVYSVTGQLVRDLVSCHQEAGSYKVPWDGRDAAGETVGNGVYLGVLQAGDFRAVTRMVLMK